MLFFNSCNTLDELKAAYKKAAMKHHPDMGGDTATMQRINAEYTARFEDLKSQQNTRAETDKHTYKTSENATDFIEIINYLLQMDGVTVELCGRWLWISGNTKNHKEDLKKAGCRWSPKKKMWSWHHAEDGIRHGKRTYSMQHIRSKYGSTRFDRQTAEADTLTA